MHDFRAINQETLLEPYSMKNIQDSMEDLSRAGSKLFSKIDLTSGFWQMFLNPDCRKYTAFTLPGIGQFEWNASPAGLVGATGSFQRLMEIVIHQLKNVLAHIDDLLVHTKDHEQQLRILDQLFIAKKTRANNQLARVYVLLAGSRILRIQNQSRRSSARNRSPKGYRRHSTA